MSTYFISFVAHILFNLLHTFSYEACRHISSRLRILSYATYVTYFICKLHHRFHIQGYINRMSPIAYISHIKSNYVLQTPSTAYISQPYQQHEFHYLETNLRERKIFLFSDSQQHKCHTNTPAYISQVTVIYLSYATSGIHFI